MPYHVVAAGARQPPGDSAAGIDLTLNFSAVWRMQHQCALRSYRPFGSAPPAVRATPLTIFNGSVGPLGGHCRVECDVIVLSKVRSPVYVPSNAVVVGAGACAATGIAEAHATIVKSVLVRPDMLPSPVTC